MIQGLSIKEAKGKFPINMEACKEFYSQCWDEYFYNNPDLYDLINQYNGFSDIFGQKGRVCQAEEIYRIRFQPRWEENVWNRLNFQKKNVSNT